MPEQTEQSKDLWTQVLDLLAKIITPNWSDVIAWLPLIIVGLVLLALAFVAYQWVRNGSYNRSRVPRRIELTPPGIHMPGPSRWPFVIPIGATLILYGLAIRPTDSAGHATAPVNLPVFSAGLLVTAIAVIGWLRDAMREWHRAEGLPEESHALAVAPGVAAAGALGPGLRVSAFPARPAVAIPPGGVPSGPPLVATRRVAAEPPPGVHMPGPSPWPFLFPLALSVVFFGLVFSPAILLGGVLMVVIAAAGWLRDAGYEFRQVEAGHPPEPRTRDPERAFPKRLLGVYAFIGLLSLALIVAPRIIAFANQTTPSTAPGASGAPGGAPGGQIAIVAEGIKFSVKDLQVPAGKPFAMTFENKDSVPHNVAIYTDAQLTKALFQGEIFSGPKTVTYNVTAIPAGQHYFVCNVHPNMNGTVTAK